MSGRGTEIDRERLDRLVAALPDERSRIELFELCRPLVRALATRFMGRGEPLEDLVQVASLGMLKAIDGFDRERGESLLSYGTAVIVGELRHHFRDTVRLVRVPRRLTQSRRRVDHAVEELTQELGRSPSAAQIAERTGLTVEGVLEAIATVEVSSPVPIEDVAETTHIEDVAMAGEFDRLDELESVSAQLADLPPRERQVLFLRFFRGYSQAEVASEIGVSQVQVSRILSGALGRIRRQVTAPDTPGAS